MPGFHHAAALPPRSSSRIATHFRPSCLAAGGVVSPGGAVGPDPPPWICTGAMKR